MSEFASISETNNQSKKFQNVEIPDLSHFVFPDDYEAFDDENLDMLP